MLGTRFARLNPADYSANRHISLTDDPGTDKAFLDIGYNYQTPDALERSFQQLMERFDKLYELAVPLLCEQWNIGDTDELPFPINDSQMVAEYSVDAGMLEYDLTLAQWLQPGSRPYPTYPTPITAVGFNSTVKGDFKYVLYYQSDVFLSGRKITKTNASFLHEAWLEGLELTPVDTMLLQQLVSSIPPFEIDSSP